MPYETVNGHSYVSDVHIVDLRSDTISKPTQEMRDAMVQCQVGDDVFREDPTVVELETRAAEMLQKEAAVFLASGTMANLIAIMVHCQKRGSEMICGDNSHTFRFEQGGPSQLAGVQMALVRNYEDGTFDLDELRDKIRVDSDCHEPITELIVVENTHNMCGGKVLPLDFLEKVKKIASEYKLPIHMDGARIMNAAVYLRQPVSRLVKDVDTVCFCLSKGLGCPVGSVLAGSKRVIEQARRMKKVLGGGWRQAGFLAAAGLVGLDRMIPRLQEDHEHTYQIAKAIHNLDSKYFKVDLANVQTNILMMYIDRSKMQAREVQHRLATVLKTDSAKVSVRTSSRDPGCVRFVLYWEISDDDVQAAIDKITLVVREYEEKFRIY